MHTVSFARPAIRSRILNTAALASICAILLFALGWQLYFDELPCPLCLLQRVAFFLIGIGLLLNVRCGSSAVHYSIILVSAVGGLAVSARQDLLHIAPGDAGYAQPFLGLHFYTWALIFFVALILYCALMLALDRHLEDLKSAGPVSIFAKCVMGIFLLLALLNLASTLLICGFGSCPDNPVRYIWP